MDGDNSSEGIVASSDDEVDGLSRAVEHHIFGRESETPESTRVATDWQEHLHDRHETNYQEHSNGPSFTNASISQRAPPHQHYSMPPTYTSDYDFRSVKQFPPHHQHQSFFSDPRHNMPLNQSPKYNDPHVRTEDRYRSHSNLSLLRPRLPSCAKTSPPLRRTPSPIHRRFYLPDLHHPPRGVQAYPQEFEPRRQHSHYHRGDHPRGWHRTHAHSPFRTIRRHSQEWDLPRQKLFLKSSQTWSAQPPGRPPPQSQPLHYPTFRHQRGKSPPFFGYSSPKKTTNNRLHSQPVSTFPDSISLPVNTTIHHKKSENSTTVAESCKNTVSGPLRRNPPPVSFKIKQSQSSHQLLTPHPLDPLSNSLQRNSKSSSPDHWCHDKYAETLLSDDKRETDSPGRKRTRSLSGKSKESKPEDKDENCKRLKILSNDPELPIEIETNPDVSQPESPESGLIHSEREERIVYKEEVVLEAETLESASAEDASLLESDDDELLGLRLQALTSALNMENHAKLKGKVPPKKKSAVKKKKPKHLLRRVYNTPKKSSKSNSRRKSEVTDKFLKKYSSMSKSHSQDKPRIVPGKPNAAQLTLFGEIVKNHQPLSKTESLHYIRSLPDNKKKTSMFLNLIRGDRVDESSAIDFIRQTILQRNVQSDEQKVKAKSLAQGKLKSHCVVDNYDEIGMDLEGDGSDSDLVPPGTDAKLIAPPLLQEQEIQHTPSRSAESELAAHTPELLATPSQESIWSMLENPVEFRSQEELETKPRERERAISEEIDIDDDGLSLLRAKLLEQIEKTQKVAERREEVESPIPEMSRDIPSETNDLEAAPLTSQYPYQPPTLQIPDVVPPTHFAVSPSVVVSSSEGTSPAEATISSASFKPNMKAQLPSSTESMVCRTSPGTAPSQLLANFPPCFVDTTSASPVLQPNEVQISSAISTAPVISPSFAPQMSSTPAETLNQKVMPSKKLGRRRRRKSKANTAVDVTTAVKVPVFETPMKIGKTLLHVKEPAVNGSTVSMAPKRLHIHPPTGAPSQDGRSSQTVVKTATTIIKTNAPTKGWPEVPMTNNQQSKQSAVDNRLPVERVLPILPRHQPVVINLGGSSDEDESILSPDKGRPQQKNPSEFHQDLLNAMIRQVREQTSRKQQDLEKYAQKPMQDGAESSKTGGNETPWPFSDRMKYPEKNNHSSFPLARKTSILEKKPALLETANQRPAKNGQKSIDKPTRAAGSSELLKQSHSKFLRLKVLIGKDEEALDRLSKVRESRVSELKSVNEELKEMMYRVAAIKGKRERCEELLKRCKHQETRIGERIDKRNALKLKLKERIEQHWLKVRAEKHLLKIDRDDPGAEVQEYVQAETVQHVSNSSSSSPILGSKSGRIDQEKQRLLAMEKELAQKISKMKHSDGLPEPSLASTNSRRSSLSKEVKSHLAKYQNMKKSAKPSIHDLSLSKIAVPALSPAKSSPKRNSDTSKENSAPIAKPKMENSSEIGKVISKEGKVSSASETCNSNRNPNHSSDTRPASVQETQNLRKFIVRSLSDWKTMLNDSSQLFVDIPYSSRAWEKPVSDCFKKWKLDPSETPTISVKDCSDQKKNEYQIYESPLRIFRCYRLNPFYRVKEKFLMNSKTFSHKINPKKIFCRYDLTGSCQDPQCKAQHDKEYSLTPTELLLDIMSYCPALLGKELKSGLEYQDVIKASESMCYRLLGMAVTQVHMSLDEKCIMLASKVNDALGNKAPYTTVLRPRPIKPKQEREDLWMFNLTHDEVGSYGRNSEVESSQCEQPDSYHNDVERYFIEHDAQDIAVLEHEVKKNPHNIQLWIELANKRMHQKSSSEHCRIELVLNTLCLALEENPYDGELWAHYLEVFHLPMAGQREEDLDEMISQAIEFVPLSTYIWHQLFSWDCNSLKREFMYDHLISNLMRNAEGESNGNHFKFEVMSRWLLQTVLQRTQLQIHRNTVSTVVLSLESTVKELSQQCIQASHGSPQHVNRCLSENDLNSMWIAYINLKHFGSLPECFLSNSKSSISAKCSLGICVKQDAEVCLQIDSKTRLDDEKYSRILSDIEFALKECCPSRDYGKSECFALLREKVHLQMAQRKWEHAAQACRILCEALYDIVSIAGERNEQQQLLTHTIVTWADALVRNGDCLEATQVFDDNVTKQPWNARLCFEAALFQINLESADFDAALLYIETCISAYMVIDCTLDKTKLKLLFCHLLGMPVPSDLTRPAFAKGITQEKVNLEKPYLWIIYCVLMELSNDPRELIIDSYEKAIDNAQNECDRKEVWLRYLRFKQLLGSSILGSGVHISRKRQIWLKSFTSVVRRCITTVSTQEEGDNILHPHGSIYDYTFHNQVATIYLACFHTRQQMTTAYHFLTELMPLNVPLLLRACRYFLTFGDHSSVLSILLKVTNTTCQSKTIWKIWSASHFLSGRIAKAIRISKQAVEVLPYSAELWSDYLALLKAYGKLDHFAAEKMRCSSTLQMDVSPLLPE